ncbi:MAG: alpha-L-rhamnosidase [Kiritimatiellae bacterium]|nr:alpha-L-rhamnosidase [Kiritimatiellia bacterium]
MKHTILQHAPSSTVHSSSMPASDNPAPFGLLCELLAHPDLSVITNPTPGFSWIVNSKQCNDHQTAFQIIVADSEKKLSEKVDLHWDSGNQNSNLSSNIRYNGKEIQSHSSYLWKVRTWNKDDRPSAWSRPQKFNIGDLNADRQWPGESNWVKLDLADGESLWTFENRHPIVYHAIGPARKVQHNDRIFLDFGRAAFAALQIQYTYKPAEATAESATLHIALGEKADADSIDREPGAGVVFREYPFEIEPGTHTEIVQVPRFEGRYPHSQVMPLHMPEVVPFRYVEIQLQNPDVVVKEVTQQALYYLFDEDASYFRCSDQRLNDVYDLCRYSVKANMFNGDYAASERERMLYEADTYIHQISHYAVDREFAIARYSLQNMIYHATWPTEWILHSILMAHADYWHTGETRVIEEHFDELTAKLMLPLASENHLISTRTGKQTPEFRKSIHFGGKSSKLRDIVDWPDARLGPAETGGETNSFVFTDFNSVVNAFHYKGLLAMSEMAEAIGKDAEAAQFLERAGKVKSAFNEAFFNSDKGIYVDGIGTDHSSLHANMFPLAFGLVEDSRKPGVIDYIKSKGMACGVYGANYLLEALFTETETEYAIGLLTSDSDRSWLNMLRVGSTMTTEAWDNKYKSNNGWSHAWSASPAHIIPRKIMGIEPLKPGFEEIRIAPQPWHLEFANCKLPTIKGPVTVEFTQTPGETFSLEFEIPANTKAKIVLPNTFSAGTVTFDGEAINPEQQNNEWFLTSGSGKHSIRIG